MPVNGRLRRHRCKVRMHYQARNITLKHRNQFMFLKQQIYEYHQPNVHFNRTTRRSIFDERNLGQSADELIYPESADGSTRDELVYLESVDDSRCDEMASLKSVDGGARDELAYL